MEDEVKAFLGSVQQARYKFQRCLWQIEELRRRCESITAGWSAEPTGSGDVHKDGPLVALADKRTEMHRLYREWEEREEEVNRFLDRLPDYKHRVILSLRYVDLLRWPVVKQRMESVGLYYEERQMFNLHGKALEAARALWRGEVGEHGHPGTSE